MPDSDEPVVDTESDAPAAEGEPARTAAPVEKGGIPTPPENAFLAELAKWDGAEPKMRNEAAADAIVAALEGVPFVVSKVEQKDRQDRPSPPFTTSTLQQQANIRLRFSTSRTMQTAQKLYEGVELSGMGQTALITYMRTDSTRVSNDALDGGADFIQGESRLGPKYLPATAERLRLRQERAGGARGDPPDRRDDHAAAGQGRGPGGRPVPALRTDLAAVRRQPVRRRRSWPSRRSR